MKLFADEVLPGLVWVHVSYSPLLMCVDVGQCENHRHKHSQTDRQADNETHRQTQRQTEKGTDRQKDRQADSQSGRQVGRYTGIHKDRKTNRRSQRTGATWILCPPKCDLGLALLPEQNSRPESRGHKHPQNPWLREQKGEERKIALHTETCPKDM